MSIIRNFLIVVLFSTFVQNSYAGEKMSEIARNKAEKELIVKAMRARIKAHEKMSGLPEIVKDLESSFAKGRLRIEAENLQAYDYVVKNILIETERSPSKDVFIALEKASLQKVLSADNVMMWLTVTFLDNARNKWGTPMFFQIAALPFVACVDVIFILPELFYSALTGF